MATLAADGRATWTDYVDYWRDADLDWVQDRLVLRAADSTARDALGMGEGGVVYNRVAQTIEVKSATGYKTLTPLPGSLKTIEGGSSTSLSYVTAGGKGVVFNVDTIAIDTPKFNAVGGVLTVDATGVSVKVGTKTAKLTTDAASLISDSPVSAPSLASSGALTVTGTATVGSLSTAGAVTAASATLSGALNANSLAVGGTAINSSGLVTGVNAQGFKVGGGVVYGDATSIIMRDAAKTGAYVQVTTATINLGGGGNIDVYNQMRFQGINPQWISGGAVRGLGYCVSAYGGDPGVGNMPEGAIWIS